MTFGWHQDSGFIPYPHPPYLTCWIPLDDVTEANGTVYLLPYPRAGTRDVVEHRRDEKTNDMIGYVGDDPGDPVVVPAESLVCFSITLFHRGGANTTDDPGGSTSRSTRTSRSSAKIVHDPGTLAEPVLIAGQRDTSPDVHESRSSLPF
jgi:ectoine hydroxylase-related dioxygenase (phytanoyl-CoA dioxygenase family)